MYLSIPCKGYDIANIDTCYVSGTQNSRRTNVRKVEKKGVQPNETFRSLCTVCGKFNHETKNCPVKSSPYANHTPSAIIGSTAHSQSLARDLGIVSPVGTPKSIPTTNLRRRKLSQCLLTSLQINTGPIRSEVNYLAS